MSRTGNSVTALPRYRVERQNAQTPKRANAQTRQRANAQTGQGFTLIEVLIAVAILSVGMIGVIRAYTVLMNSVGIANFAVEASYLLKNRMADVQKSTIEGTAGRGPWTVDRGPKCADPAAFKWEEDVSDVIIEGEVQEKDPENADGAAQQEEKPREILKKVSISVFGGEGFGPVRKMSLYTYLQSRPEVSK